MVVMTKDFNFSQKPQINVLTSIRGSPEIIRKFKLPPRPQYVLLNMKNVLKYHQVEMKKEISFTLIVNSTRHSIKAQCDILSKFVVLYFEIYIYFSLPF